MGSPIIECGRYGLWNMTNPIGKYQSDVPIPTEEKACSWLCRFSLTMDLGSPATQSD